MDLEKVLRLIFNSPDNIKLEYSNVDGKETFFINGEDVLEDKNKVEEFNDSEIKEKINNFSEIILKLDEWIWDIVLDTLKSREYDIKNLSKFLNKDTFTEDEAETASEIISEIENIIYEAITSEILKLEELRSSL